MDHNSTTDDAAQSSRNDASSLLLGIDSKSSDLDLNVSDSPSHRSVLSIEDELFISELYSRALLKAGYLVTIERDGKKGLELAQTDSFDIILLDLLLPSMHGTEILQRLRDPTQTPHLHSKIIITTNFEERKEVHAEIEKLADAYLVKVDVTPNQLVEFLNQIK